MRSLTNYTRAWHRNCKNVAICIALISYCINCSSKVVKGKSYTNATLPYYQDLTSKTHATTASLPTTMKEAQINNPQATQKPKKKPYRPRIFETIHVPIDQVIQKANSATVYKQFKQRYNELNTKDNQLQQLVQKCSRNKQNLGEITNLYNFSYIHDEPHFCEGHIFLITVVHSHINNIRRRNVIRKTWGSLKFVGTKRVSVLFFVGTDGNPETQHSLNQESLEFRDIIQKDFKEHYRNMSLKHLTVYEWLSTRCSHAMYTMKVDDDTFVDMFHAVSFLASMPPSGMYCSATTGARPRRKGQHYSTKWQVTMKEYRWKQYPPYCEGLGYIVPTSQITPIYLCSLFSDFFWIDDVFVGGLLPKFAGVPLTRFVPGHGYATMLPSFASAKIMDVIFLTAYYSEFLEGMWAKLWKAVLTYSMDPTA